MKLKGKVVVVWTVDVVIGEIFYDGEQEEGAAERFAAEIKAGGDCDPSIEVHVIPFGGTRRTAKMILEALDKRSTRSSRVSSAPEIMKGMGLTPDGEPNVPGAVLLEDGGGVMLPAEKVSPFEIGLDLGPVPELDSSEEVTVRSETRSLEEIDPFAGGRMPDGDGDDDDTSNWND